MATRVGLLHLVLRTPVRRLIFPFLESVWSAGFQIVGWIWRPKLIPIEFSGGKKVLVLSPHADDETIGCGGAIIAHVRAGDDVTVCIITDGSNSRAGNISKDEMAAKREAEAVAAMQRLGGPKLCTLDLVEGSWTDNMLSPLLHGLLKETKPDLIYTSSVVDYHPEHIKVANCLARALQTNTGMSGTVIRLFEVQVPLTPLLANRCLDITYLVRIKYSALQAYSTQFPSLLWLKRYMRYQRRLYRSEGYLEVFREVDAQSFASAVSETSGNFYGIRARPLSDPLAWLFGWNARVRLGRQLTRR